RLGSSENGPKRISHHVSPRFVPVRPGPSIRLLISRLKVRFLRGAPFSPRGPGRSSFREAISLVVGKAPQRRASAQTRRGDLEEVVIEVSVSHEDRLGGSAAPDGPLPVASPGCAAED